MHPTPKVVSDQDHPVDVGEQMARHEVDVVGLVSEGAPVSVAFALDVLRAVLSLRDLHDRRS
jgi:hypothetical protein